VSSCEGAARAGFVYIYIYWSLPNPQNHRTLPGTLQAYRNLVNEQTNKWIKTVMCQDWYKCHFFVAESFGSKSEEAQPKETTAHVLSQWQKRTARKRELDRCQLSTAAEVLRVGRWKVSTLLSKGPWGVTTLGNRLVPKSWVKELFPECYISGKSKRLTIDSCTKRETLNSSPFVFIICKPGDGGQSGKQISMALG
jgi:hypothetical protein